MNGHLPNDLFVTSKLLEEQQALAQLEANAELGPRQRMDQFGLRLGVATGNLVLTRDAVRYKKELAEAARLVRGVHEAVSADVTQRRRFGDLLGGRQRETAEAMLAAVVAGSADLAVEIYRLAAEPDQFFCLMVPVLKLWLTGAYLEGDQKTLEEALGYNPYPRDLVRAWVEIYRALYQKSARKLNEGLALALRAHARNFRMRGGEGRDVLPVDLLGVAVLARHRGLTLTVDSPHLPKELLKKLL